jgi:hypothetical protein
MTETEPLLAREKLIETLEQMMGGKLSFIDGTRIVRRLIETAGYDPLSEPFVAFVAIDSETDAVPTGKVRDLWQPDAVAKHAKEWSQSEAWAKQAGEPACREALELLRSA